MIDARQADDLMRTQAAVGAPNDVGFIELAGPDARSFLQNLGTNDVRSLSPGEGCELFFTTHKARIVAHAVALCVRDDAFVLNVESNRAEALFKHLSRFHISEDFELTLLGSSWSMVRVLGPDSKRSAEKASGVALDELAVWHGSAFSAGGWVRRQGSLHPLGYEFFGPAAVVADRLQELLADGLQLVGTNAIEPIRIESGWPRWGHEMDDNRFVVELDRTAQAISYQKGCYLGQEPIVMARDRGQVNRRLMGLRIPGTELPTEGTKLMSGEVEVVRITSAAYSPAWKSAVGLAFVHRGQHTAGATIVLPGPSGALTATLSSLPMVPD